MGTPDPSIDESALAWLESLADGGRRLVVVRSDDRRTLYVSDNVKELTGWDADEFSRRVYSLLHPEDQPRLFEASRALRREGATERKLTARLEHPDGHFQEFTGTVVDRGDDAAVSGIVVVVAPTGTRWDDTSRWHALLASAGEILIIQSRDLTVDYVSPSVEKVLGVTPDQLVHEATDRIHPDDLGEFLRTRSRVAEEPDGEARMRLRMRGAGDVMHTLDVTIANHFGQRPVDGLVLRARDISDLIATEHLLDRSEARFEAIVATGPGASLLVDSDTNVVYCSEGIETLLGYQPDELVGRSGFDYIHPDDRQRAVEEMAELLAGTHGTAAPTIRFLATDGSYVPLDVSAADRLDDPRLRAVVLSLRDVTERVTAERRLQRLLRDSSGAAFVIDRDQRVTWTTPGVERFIGDRRELHVDMAHTLLADVDVDRSIAVFEAVLTSPPGAAERILCRLGPGEQKRWVDITLTNAFDDPAIDGIIVNIRDVDDAVRANQTGHRLTEVLESTTDLVCVYDRDLNLIWANAAAVEVLGHPPVPGAAMQERMAPDSLEVIAGEMIPTLRAEGVWRGELALARESDGEEVPIEVTVLAHRGTDGVEFISAIARDISARKILESQLHAKARLDALTGLPNRFTLTEQLDAMVSRREAVGLLFLDLDQFKVVNDTQGHDAGDRLLIAAADRLRGALRPTDLVARFGGDEFIVVLPGVTNVDDALALGERVLDRVRGHVNLGTIDIYLTASAGVALSDGGDSSTLISNADAAMYKAKAAGRDRIAAYSAELRSRTVERLETAHQLRAAVEDDHLDVWFQPIVDTKTGFPIALEALARWENGPQGFVPPDHFIAVAEETGLIRTLGSAIIHKTCAAIRELGSVAESCTFSVNLSVHQLSDATLPDILGAAIGDHGVDPRQLHCEITESAVMEDVENSSRVLDRIRDLGIGIAIDDFGTGYSSLAYLHRLPVDVLKIDRAFVAGLSFDTAWDRSLAAGIVSLGHSLGLEIVAEGVESAEQATILRKLGCDAMQGFLFARPTPLRELGAVLEAVMHPEELRRT